MVSYWASGLLPHSKRLIQDRVFRYQHRNFIEPVETWYRMFWDTPRKWEVPQRYAGKHHASGHYFGLTQNSALENLNAYNQNVNDFALLEFCISIDEVFALTTAAAIEYAGHRYKVLNPQTHWKVLLDELISKDLGGESIGSYIGWQALLEGYNGIIYYSAPGADIMRGANINILDNPTFDYLYAKDKSHMDLVIYFCHNVLRSTEWIKYDGIKKSNPFHKYSIKQIDDLFAADPKRPTDLDLSLEEQRHRASRIAYFQRPSVGFGSDI